MANLAKERLQAILDAMRKYDWHTFSFPNHALRFGQLLLLMGHCQELPNKLPIQPPLPPNNCWNNAREFQKEYPEHTYWEGFIANKGSAWPTPHAWCMLGDLVVDPTVDSSKYDYFGFNADEHPDWVEFQHP